MTCRVLRLALVSLILLAACDRPDPSAAFTDTRLPPGLSARFWPPSGWAWGLLQVEGFRQPLRYGVAAPVGVSEGDVIILPSHAESAEMWFETARDLIADGYTVWILEGAGEGGSGREGRRREVGHLKTFDADIRALVALDQKIAHPNATAGVIASGTAALPALAAVKRGYSPAVLVLSGPFEPKTEPWARPGADASPRRRAVETWALANPDLRMGGVSRHWRKARRALERELAETPSPYAGPPIRIIAPDQEGPGCDRLPSCERTIMRSNEAYPYAADAVRDPWLGLIAAALNARLP